LLAAVACSEPRELFDLEVLEGVTFERDLGPFVHQAIDAQRSTVFTDGFAS
jgi:hypothetical protein